MKPSITAAIKSRGRPAIGKGTPVQTRWQPADLSRLDEWVRAQPDPKPSRPDAIRQLVRLAIDANSPAPRASLDEQIATAEAQIAQKVPAKPSPAKGMAKLRKGLAENELKKLVAKKRRKAGDD